MLTGKHLLCCELILSMRSGALEEPLEVNLPLLKSWAIFQAVTAAK